MSSALDSRASRSDSHARPTMKASGLRVGYGSTVVVGGIDLTVQPGQVHVLIGPNGAGKSTLLKTLMRQLALLGGTVLLDGRELAAFGGAELARAMAMLSTERVDPELMTCADVVQMGRYPHTGRLGILGDADRQAVSQAMELVGVADLAEQPFACVSDGQRQRVMLARAIAQEPRILVLDEPTSYLDIRHKLELLRILRELAHERGIAVVSSLHELELARAVADVVVCVAHGGIDRVDVPERVFAGGYIRRLYEVDDDAFDQIYPGLDARHEVVCDAAERSVRAGQRRLRRGVTTGTCAALATAGAVRLLLSGRAPDEVSLTTPKGIRVEVPIDVAELADGAATCGVRKDAGDDPDVTDGIFVMATVEQADEGIRIDGGEGVGRVTKPGLDQPVGEAAINRVPRQMIAEQARSVASELGYEGGLFVTIWMPEGARIAERTFNAQLGVVGGLSVLGTSGIEEPMSEQALIDTIELNLRQVRSEGADTVVLLPGNYAEEFVRDSLDGLDGLPQVKFSNYLGEALDAAVALGFAEVLVVGHIGKLVKVAGGVMNTHSKVADCRMELMCAHAAACGADRALCQALLQAATTDACLDLLDAAGLVPEVMDRLLSAMQRHLEQRVHGALRVGIVVFSNQRSLLGAVTERLPDENVCHRPHETE